jgi:hypothetical protein
MKKQISFVLCLGFIVIASLIVSCGQQNTNPTTTTTSTTVPGGISSISGSLSSGTVSSAIRTSSSGNVIQAYAGSSLTGYTVAAISKDTGDIYFSTPTDSSGNFTIANLPSHESFYLDVLDSSNQLAAPVAFGTTGGKAVMAIEASNESVGSIDLGAIVIDSSKKAAAPSIAPTANLDASTTVEVKSGETLVPLGAGNLGKGSATEIPSGTYNSTVADGDKDGLPNFLDADNNGDLVPDEFDGMFTKEVFGVSASGLYAFAFTNLKVEYGNRNTYKTTYNTFSIALGVAGPKGPGAKNIDTVRVIAGPSWITKAKIIADPPVLWSTTDYAIPAKGSQGFEVQLGRESIKPVTDVNAGDTFKILVNYTDGTSAETVKMLNFVFTEIPSVAAIKIGSGSWQNPGVGDVFNTTTSEVGLRWFRPKDESGNEIKGGRYTFEYNSTSGGAIETVVITKDATTATSLEAIVNYDTLPDRKYNTGTGHKEFMLGICIRDDANSNSANNTRFQAEGW